MFCDSWTGEWWYRNLSESDATFKKFDEDTKTVWVYLNNTDNPIRYLCNISSSDDCEKGSGYLDLVKGVYLLHNYNYVDEIFLL